MTRFIDEFPQLAELARRYDEMRPTSPYTPPPRKPQKPKPYQYAGVYVIEIGNGLFKIGGTNNIARRLREHRCSHFASTLLTVFPTPNYKKLEHDLQDRFWDKSVGTEFFSLTSDEVNILCSEGTTE